MDAQTWEQDFWHDKRLSRLEPAAHHKQFVLFFTDIWTALKMLLSPVILLGVWLSSQLENFP